MLAGLDLFVTVLVVIAAIVVRPIRRWFRTRQRPLRTVGLLGIAWLVVFVVLAAASPQPATTANTTSRPQAAAATAPVGTSASAPAPAAPATTDTPVTTADSAAASTGTAEAGSCHARTEDGQPLPDPRCTPGATDPAVTADTIGATICHTGWTSTVRPSVGVTEPLKIRQIADYGYPDAKTGDYEEDHLVPLELGGSPSDPRNLWPEFDGGVLPNAKDAVENTLNHAVCRHQVGLADAQRAIAADWTTALAVLGLTGAAAGPPPAAPAAPPAPAAGGSDVYYPNCAAARAAGAAPLYRGQPGYRPQLDRDGDGIACEK